MSKAEFRKKMFAVRENISKSIKENAPKECMQILRRYDIYQETEIIYIFVAFGEEINTKEMIEDMLAEGKRIAVPKVEGKEMIFREISSLEDCVPGIWGILEPKKELPVLEEPGMILVPGLGFDKNGHRIGYGGGYYDKYLEVHTDLLRVGLAYEEQLVEGIPYESHDIIVNYLLTPSKLRKIC